MVFTPTRMSIRAASALYCRGCLGRLGDINLGELGQGRDD
jgi:hypothetical protein